MSNATHEARPLRGNTPLSLRGEPGGAWLVAAGVVDVFTVDVVEGRSEGARVHVIRLEPGTLLLSPSSKAWPDPLDLLAVGSVDARVTVLAPADLTGRTDLVRGWAEGLGRAAEACGARDLPLGELCVQLDAATGSDETANVTDGPLPWESALDAVHVRALSHLALARLDLREAAELRLRLRGDVDIERFHSALARLSDVLNAEALPTEVDIESVPDPLVASCRRACLAQGIDLSHADDPPPVAERAAAGALADPVAAIARYWRLRVRLVMLRDDWAAHDSGPLVAFRDDGAPVAIVPLSPRRCEMVDGSTGARCPVDDVVAQRLRPRAYAFYRPLPDRSLQLRDIVSFCLQGSRRDLATVLVTLVVGGLLGMVVPVVTGFIVGTVIPGADRGLLVQLVLGLLWTSMSLAVFSLVQAVALNRVEQIMEAPLQAAVWDRLLNLPVNFFRRYNAGDLAARVMGVSTIRRALTGAALSSILGLVMSFFNLCLLFWYDVGLALTAIGLLAVQMGALFVSLRLQIRRQRRVSDVQGRLSGILLQFFSGITKIRVAGVEARAFGVWARQFARQSELAYDARRVATAMASFDAAFGIATSMVVYAVVAFGGLRLSTGDFLAFTSALGSFLAAFLSMNAAIATVIAAIPAYERSVPILEAVPEVEPSRARVPVLKGEVDLSHVTFRYQMAGDTPDERTDGPLILNDVSIRAERGQFVAIVGPSGAGKSTVFRLLLGFEMPQAGSVYLDGESLQHLDVQAVRSQIGVVLQNGRLMSGDIFHNIVGARALTLDDAWRAAELAGIADEIRAMPMGMNTVISEGAGNLSGGQRQRLLIARAVAGNPRILLFDEATSALDNYTQSKVSEALRRLPATRIVIAHRLSTVQDADRIYVLKDARVAESGTFDELLAAHGPFWDLVQRQLA